MKLTTNADKIFRMKYSINGKETWEEACLRVAEYVAEVEGKFGKNAEEINAQTQEYFDLIYNLSFVPGGRVIANAGTNIKNLNNCFVLPVEDSRESIYNTLKNAAEVFAWGGGLGYNFSKLREEGAEIKTTGGKASGPLSFMSLFDQTGEVIQQASRRGAQMGMLNIDHPDILKFIEYKATPNSRNKRLLEEYHRNLKLVGGQLKNTKYYNVLEKTLLDDQLTHFNISVVITDKFMDAVTNDKIWELKSRENSEIVMKIPAREIISRIAKRAWESGDPGVFFFDRTNEDNIVPYLGDLEVTNPCVTGDTLIQTVEGEIKIKDLVGKEIDVYCMGNDGELTISKAKNIRKTRENANLIKIVTSRGELICTPDHLIHTNNRGYVKAIDLKLRDKPTGLIRSMTGERYCSVWLNSNKSHKEKEHRFIMRHYQDITNKDVHHIDENPINNIYSNLEVLNHSEHSRKTNLGHENYHISGKDGRFLKKAVHKTKKDRKIILGEFPIGVNLFIKSVEKLEYKENVYDLEVENYHNFIANRIVIHNCGEVPLLPYEPCCLGSINLYSIYSEVTGQIDWEYFEHLVRKAVRFLDNVQEISFTPLEKINEFSKGLRRLGLGVMGWADLLAELEIPYDSDEAINLAEYISWFISYFAWLESIELAEERGAFPFYEKEHANLKVLDRTLNSKYNPYKYDIEEIRKNGIRNVSVTSIAPTGSIALIAGVNSGIEPFFALAYYRNITEGVGNTEKDRVIEINPILLRKLKQANFSQEQIDKVKKYIMDCGTIKGCSLVPEKIQNIFVTAMEISWEKHIEMQSAWQTYVTNAVSKTINMENSATEEDIFNAYLFAWIHNLKGVTIYRDGSKSFQILNVIKKKND